MYLFDLLHSLSPGFSEFPSYSAKHRLLFTQMHCMISDLLVVMPINTQLGCQPVTPCCNNLFSIRDLIHEEGGEYKNPSVVLFFTWKYTGVMQRH